MLKKIKDYFKYRNGYVKVMNIATDITNTVLYTKLSCLTERICEPDTNAISDWYNEFRVGNLLVSHSIEEECRSNPDFEEFIQSAFVRQSREKEYDQFDKTKPVIGYYDIPSHCRLGEGYGKQIKITTSPKDRNSYASFEYEED